MFFNITTKQIRIKMKNIIIMHFFFFFPFPKGFFFGVYQL
eukprot:UN01213